MNKRIVLSLALLMALGTSSTYAASIFNYDLQKDVNRTRDAEIAAKNAAKNGDSPQSTTGVTVTSAKDRYAVKATSDIETTDDFYPNANLASAINKYKEGNYTGCLQELMSYDEKDPANPLTYYYMAMAYTQVGDRGAAQIAYDKVISLSSDQSLTDYATKGKACLTGDKSRCRPELNDNENTTTPDDVPNELDEFIAAPYGNGLSEEVNADMKQRELNRIQRNINNNQELQKGEFRRLKELENNQSTKPSNDEVLAALDVLKRAGVTVSINEPETEEQRNMKLAAQMMGNQQAQQYNELSMLLGNNNYNNNNNNMLNMLPLMLAQNNGKNMDSQMIQTMMMQSMIPDVNFNLNNNTY